MTSRLHCPFLFTAVLVGTAALSLGWAAQPANEAQKSEKPAAKGQPALAGCCAAMKKMGDEETVTQNQSDASLSRLLVTMNEASGSTKVDAMAAVINELVKQRADTREHMARMDSAMKEHMMQHVMASAPADMGEKMNKSMEGCSMMRGPVGGCH
ncbi:MAG: hypothetical protein PSX37_04555 [bacterium]|nr:hypothetical protein [bacterium]